MTKIRQWQMIRLKDDFQMVEAEMPEIHANEALVKVSGCGVCHTDLSFWNELNPPLFLDSKTLQETFLRYLQGIAQGLN